MSWLYDYRYEMKYIISPEEEAILKVKLDGLLQKDPHVGPGGTYLITSLYFDDLYDSCLGENFGGTDPRSKFRIRHYNCDLSRISLEKKIKDHGMTKKDSCRITREECESLMEGKVPPVSGDMPEEKKRLFTEMLLRDLKPKVIVRYERIPYVGEPGTVRITLDRCVASSNQVWLFLERDYACCPVFPEYDEGAYPMDDSVLEVKWTGIMPSYLMECLQLDSLARSGYSKYMLCRINNIYGGIV